MGRRINWTRWHVWALVVLSACLRLYQLGGAPEFIIDEGYNVETARGLLDHGQMTRWFLQVPFMDLNKPVLYYALLGRVIALLGLGPWQVRLLSALAGIATTYLLFLLGRTVWDARTGLLAGLLHATAHPMLWADRVAKEDTLAAALALLGLYLSVLGVQRERVRYAVLSGLALGAGLSVKLSIVYAPLGLLTALVVLALMRALPWRLALGLAGGLAAATALGVLPWLSYYYHFKDALPFSAGMTPFSGLMAPEFLSHPHSMLLRPAELLHPGALAARTERILTQLFVWDPVRAVGLLGMLTFVLTRRLLRDRGVLVIAVVLLAGLAAFWVVGGRLRYVHFALLLLYLLAGLVFARVWEATRRGPGRRLVPVAIVLLMGLGLTHSPDRLDTLNYEYPPVMWRPILTPNCDQLPRAARWLQEHVPPGTMVYADSAVGSLTRLPYVDLLYFANGAEVYRRYRPAYLVVTYRLRNELAEGRGLDPHATFELEPAHEVTGGNAQADVEIYFIRGLKSARTMVRRGGVPEPL